MWGDSANLSSSDVGRECGINVGQRCGNIMQNYGLASDMAWECRFRGGQGYGEHFRLFSRVVLQNDMHSELVWHLVLQNIHRLLVLHVERHTFSAGFGCRSKERHTYSAGFACRSCISSWKCMSSYTITTCILSWKCMSMHIQLSFCVATCIFSWFCTSF